MGIARKIICWVLLLLCLNFTLLVRVMPNTLTAVLVGIALGVFYFSFNIRSVKIKSSQLRLRILNGGRELLLAAMVCFPLELLLYLHLLSKGAEVEGHLLLINGIICAVLLLIMLLNGIVRIFTCSTQLGILPRILLLLFWWMPVVNLLLLHKYLSVSQKEYQFGSLRQERKQSRQTLELCKTKYPILMVHGIFFRDWKAFNYWGRIPKELIGNGAAIHYGKHQSSACVEQCAQELKQCVLDIVAETGCEKVNIIAHSKGGLDCRYMISALNMGDYVASLTTINTPHHGCNYVRRLLNIIPNKVVAFIGRKYNSIYTKLGDDSPDFFSGLQDLTDTKCARLSEMMPDVPGVCYQSVASKMRSWSSAMFPMNIGYATVKLFGGGDNDGLVSIDSMVWGDFLGVISPRGKKGISHADMIDLTRKDVDGFDVCEFYVDLVNKLKQEGM